MTPNEVLTILENEGAVLRNSHFALTPKEDPPGSGRYSHFHSDTYILKDRVFENALQLHLMGEAIAQKIAAEVEELDFLVAPEKGALGLVNNVSFYLQQLKFPNLGIGYAEVKGEGFEIGRQFGRNYNGRKVGIIEDILNSGTTVRKVTTAVNLLGGIPVIAYAICQRGPGDTGDVPSGALCTIPATMWPEDECLACRDPARGPQTIRTDVNKHGVAFLKRKGLIA